MGDIFKWMIILALIAVVAGWLGFGGLSRLAGMGAKRLLLILIVGAVLKDHRDRRYSDPAEHVHALPELGARHRPGANTPPHLFRVALC